MILRFAASRDQRQVPADLDTLCLKCLEKDPSRRFPTAAALAQELHRFLNGEPILSRPITQWERASKWCQRNPAVARAWLYHRSRSLFGPWLSHALVDAGIVLVGFEIVKSAW